MRPVLIRGPKHAVRAGRDQTRVLTQRDFYRPDPLLPYVETTNLARWEMEPSDRQVPGVYLGKASDTYGQHAA